MIVPRNRLSLISRRVLGCNKLRLLRDSVLWSIESRLFCLIRDGLRRFLNAVVVVKSRRRNRLVDDEVLVVYFDFI